MPSNNRMLIAAVALLASGSALAQTAPRPSDADGPPPSTGPNATSDRTADRFDEVGYASVATDAPPIYVAKIRGIATGGYAEITALDSGRTTLVRSDGEDVPVGTLAWLSPTAAAAIGLQGQAAVRVRRVTPSPADRNALTNGAAPSQRLDAPPSLLAGLRTRLPAKPVVVTHGGKPVAKPGPNRGTPPATATAPTIRPARRPTAPSPTVPATSGLYVQLAAFGTADRANALARSVGGSVSQVGRLFRVRTGPYATAAEATRARDAAARRGYAEARVVRDN